MKYLIFIILIIINNSVYTQEVRTILDYYYKLPFSPYFENEFTEIDNKEIRDSGLVKLNIKNGYLIGGYPNGPKFTMTMFKDRNKNIDYILLQRLSYPGDMFDGFFYILSYVSGEWINTDSILQIDSKIIDNLKPEEECVPVLPEYGTTVVFRRWDSTSDISLQNSPILIQMRWNGMKFEIVNN